MSPRISNQGERKTYNWLGEVCVICFMENCVVEIEYVYLSLQCKLMKGLQAVKVVGWGRTPTVIDRDLVGARVVNYDEVLTTTRRISTWTTIVAKLDA